MRAVLVLACLLCLPASAAAPEETWAIGNAMARQYEAWAHLRNARVSAPASEGTLATQEWREWQKVKSAWRVLERSVDLEYSGK